MLFIFVVGGNGMMLTPVVRPSLGRFNI